jgi:hypothetical protein
MTTRTSLLAAVAASIAVLASGRALAQTTTAAPAAPPGKTWSFSTGNARPGSRAVAAARAVNAMVFTVSANGVAQTRVTKMGFMVTGTLQNSDVANFQLVFYPNGVASPGVVVGSSTGSTWAPGKTSSIVNIDLASPFDVQGAFTGIFELRVDVNGVRSFDFQPQLQTVTVASGVVEQYVLDTDDLPLPGDSLVVK